MATPRFLFSVSPLFRMLDVCGTERYTTERKRERETKCVRVLACPRPTNTPLSSLSLFLLPHLPPGRCVALFRGPTCWGWHSRLQRWEADGRAGKRRSQHPAGWKTVCERATGKGGSATYDARLSWERNTPIDTFPPSPTGRKGQPNPPYLLGSDQRWGVAWTWGPEPARKAREGVLDMARQVRWTSKRRGGDRLPPNHPLVHRLPICRLSGCCC